MMFKVGDPVMIFIADRNGNVSKENPHWRMIGWVKVIVGSEVHLESPHETLNPFHLSTGAVYTPQSVDVVPTIRHMNEEELEESKHFREKWKIERLVESLPEESYEEVIEYLEKIQRCER